MVVCTCTHRAMKTWGTSLYTHIIFRGSVNTDKSWSNTSNRNLLPGYYLAIWASKIQALSWPVPPEGCEGKPVPYFSL